MTKNGDGLSLEQGTIASGMSFEELWIRQVSVGGVAGVLEVEAYVLGVLRPDAYQHDLLAQALNEHFIEGGGNHPVAYSDDDAVNR